jgi:hypothetical protein
MFDKFCILSLTYRSNGFITMLAPLRDYLRPKDPRSSPLLRTTKQYYFARLSADVHPGGPGFEESRWITSEDVNVEHLLDVFTSIDADSEDAWGACGRFMNYLTWHKPRLVMLGPKIEALPDDHPSKAQCLWNLSWLFKSVGNLVERKRLLAHTLKLSREEGGDHQVARILSALSDTNRMMGLLREGIQQGREASEIFKRLGDTVKQASCLINLAYALHDNKQLTPQRKPHPAQLTSSRRKAKNFWSAAATAFSATYITTRAIQKKRSTISRWPSKLHPLSTTTPSCSGSITPCRSCLPRKADSTTHTPTSNAPSRTRPTTHTFWLARHCCRLILGSTTYV